MIISVLLANDLALELSTEDFGILERECEFVLSAEGKG